MTHCDSDTTMAVLKLDWRTFGLTALTGSETTRLAVDSAASAVNACEIFSVAPASSSLAPYACGVMRMAYFTAARVALTGFRLTCAAVCLTHAATTEVSTE